MTDTHNTRSPLARLVLFMICLSLAGSAVAGIHYYAVDLPQQKALQEQAPLNASKCVQDCLAAGGGYVACQKSCGFCRTNPNSC